MASDYAMSTKARSFYAQHLTGSQYRTLINQGDVPGIAAYLKNETRYGDVLDGINEKAIHRDVLEQRIRLKGQLEFLKLMRYVQPEHMKFYQFYTKRTEIDQILYVLHAIESNVSHHINYYVGDLNDLLTIDIHKLAQCKTFAEVHEFLSTTDYKNILNNLLDEDVDLSVSEDALRVYYQNFLLKLVAKESNRKELEGVIFMNEELDTIGYVYRMKKYYNFEPRDIFARIHYHPHFIPERVMNDWIVKLDADQFLDAFHQSPYGKYAAIPETVNIELHLNSIRFKIFRRMMRFATNTNLTLFAYMFLLHREIENITDIIEGVRYNMNPEEIYKLLIV
ncbi:V-type ATPase subunit [Erysipelothrix sp. HDW6C]|uniref:V-type ATPase subunit n=1 Tax=Erysipelothrix sp. HDW6C TaxID=2714930 RepID=UPI0014080FDC|nr:V-type ATPase subunit [Erysipelothrix sp. HDW6C]QIK69932.1 V-type ATPase subunit [Erysipelothrix sp. HDW6C]